MAKNVKALRAAIAVEARSMRGSVGKPALPDHAMLISRAAPRHGGRFTSRERASA